jgi:hypothetical protein
MIAIQLNERVKRPEATVFVPYSPDHLSYINTNNPDIEAMRRGGGLQDMVDGQASIGEAVTVLTHGKPTAIFGIVPIWDGLAEIWLIPDESLRIYPLFMTKAARTFIDICMISKCLHRLQITVRCDHRQAVGWARTIGFTQEGTLSKYGPDQSDFFMMSMTR